VEAVENREIALKDWIQSEEKGERDASERARAVVLGFDYWQLDPVQKGRYVEYPSIYAVRHRGPKVS
jgi:hypothetical protein